MDVTAYLQDLDQLFIGPPQAEQPREPQHQAVCDEVEGMTTANTVAVLNLAARHLPPDEAYLEVGSFRGRSLCGAVRGVDDRTFIAIENFVEFGMMGVEARTALMSNIAQHAGGKDLTLLEGDAFRLMTDRTHFPKPVGVYFYDGEHTILAHYLALAAAEPLLADEALVLVDDATWPLVQKAHRRYLSRRRGWSVVRRFDAARQDDPYWANGLHLLRYHRTGPVSRVQALETKALLVAQRRLVGPARKAVWATLHKLPWLTPLAKKLNPTSSSTVPTDE